MNCREDSKMGKKEEVGLPPNVFRFLKELERVCIKLDLEPIGIEELEGVECLLFTPEDEWLSLQKIQISGLFKKFDKEVNYIYIDQYRRYRDLFGEQPRVKKEKRIYSKLVEVSY